MTFTVIVPTYNRLEVLRSCLKAILALDFSEDDYEVFLVDDGSTDGTTDFLRTLREPRVRVIFQSHKGPAVARNSGAGRSTAEFLAFTDDDCLVPRNWLTELDGGFKRWPKVAAVGGYLEAPPEVLKGNALARLEYFETHAVYRAGKNEYLGGFESPTGGTNNLAYRRDVFESLGGFDEKFPVPAGEDADLKLRAVTAGYQFGYLPIKVTHLDPYSGRSFWRRSLVHGIGSAFFEEKHGRLLTKSGLVREAGRLPLSFFRLLISSRDLSVTFLIIVKGFLMVVGKLQYLRHGRESGKLKV